MNGYTDRYHDATEPKAEVHHAGMSAIRRGLGPGVFYRPINNPLGVAMSIANDTFGSWELRFKGGGVSAAIPGICRRSGGNLEMTSLRRVGG